MSKLPPNLFIFLMWMLAFGGEERPGECWIRLREEGGEGKDEGKVNEESCTTGKPRLAPDARTRGAHRDVQTASAHAAKRRDGETAVKAVNL